MPEGEPKNQHNEHIIFVHSKKNNQWRKIIARISDASTKVTDGLASKSKDFQVIAKVGGKSRVSLEEVNEPNGGTEISYIEFSQIAKVNKSDVWEKTK